MLRALFCLSLITFVISVTAYSDAAAQSSDLKWQTVIDTSSGYKITVPAFTKVLPPEPDYSVENNLVVRRDSGQITRIMNYIPNSVEYRLKNKEFFAEFMVQSAGQFNVNEQFSRKCAKQMKLPKIEGKWCTYDGNAEEDEGGDGCVTHLAFFNIGNNVISVGLCGETLSAEDVTTIFNSIQKPTNAP